MPEKPQDQPAPVQQPSQPAMTGVRKRQQIQDTNKRIFIWLAVAAVIVSICLVALQFLLREFMFNQKIINQKGETNKTLVQNLGEAEKLRENVNALLADENLNSLKYETSNTKTTALNVVLDALPVEGDTTAFANSLQAVVLPRSGVSITELTTSVTQDGGVSTIDPSVPVAPATQPSPLPFTAGFTGRYADIQRALDDMSRVIRPINLQKLTIRASDKDILQVSTSGMTYYMPARTVEVRTEVMKP